MDTVDRDCEDTDAVPVASTGIDARDVGGSSFGLDGGGDNWNKGLLICVRLEDVACDSCEVGGLGWNCLRRCA